MKAGIIQALSHLGITNTVIAQITGKSTQYITNICGCRNGVKRLIDREDKKELLKQATSIIVNRAESLLTEKEKEVRK